MSDLTTLPLEDGYETTLSQELTAAGSTMNVVTAGSFTFPAGETCYATINPGKSNVEVVEISAVSGTAYTIANRNIDQGNGVTTTAQTHAVGSKVIISDNYKFWADIQTAVNSKMNTSGGTFTGAVDFSGASTTFRLPNLTTAERDALGSPANGMKIYNTTAGEEQVYDGGAWATVATGSTVPNASTTVAGIVEEATDAEVGAGTAAGATAARLFINPGSAVKTSSGAGDENKIPVLNASGQLASGFMGEAGTFFDNTDMTGAEAETLSDGSNADSLHTHAFSKRQGTDTTGATISNTTTETTLATYSIPGGTLGTNNILEMKIVITDFKLTQSQSCTFRVKYGATTIASDVFNGDSSVNGAGYTGIIEASLMGAGGTGSQEGAIHVCMGFSSMDNGGTYASGSSGAAAGAPSEDSTTTLNFVVTAQMSNASTNDELTAAYSYLKLID